MSVAFTNQQWWLNHTQIPRSLRFNSADSAYLSRTPGSAGNRQSWTWSGWVKRSSPDTGSRQVLFAAYGAGNDTGYFEFGFDGGASVGKFYWTQWTVDAQSTAVFRDFSAWYHIVVNYNGTNIVVYVNGTSVLTSAKTGDLAINGAFEHGIGRQPYSGRYFSGYLADIHFIDGQALEPTAFGTFDSNGDWQKIPYEGTYGTNGFHLPFTDNSTAAALGTDTSGNGNTWTVNNISVTAGAGNDSLVDSPTNYGTDTGAGGEVRGNYCTINPLDQRFTDNGTISNGNLDYVQSSTGSRTARCTIGVFSGKWYWEFTHLGGNASHGISKASSSLGSFPGGADADGWSWFAGGNIYNNSTSTATYAGLTYTTNDVIGLALDLDAGTLTYYKNGVSQGTAVSGLTGTWFPSFGSSSAVVVSMTANFGQRPFAYTAPSGFKALCTQNLPTPTIANGATAMDVKLYTGNGSTQTISGLNFSPDFVWLKRRSSAQAHYLYDVIRGTSSVLFSDGTDAEQSISTGLTAFNSDGFSLGSLSGVNASSTTYAAWTWDAGSSTVTNTQGSITSQVRANPSAGFSAGTWTGTASAGTIGHGLGVAPEFIIVKNRSVSDSWYCYHKSLGNAARIQLNETSAQTTGSSQWNSTSPTSTVYSVGAGSWQASGNLIVCYAFAPVAGYSSFGSYTGNGSADGPFVYTGFRVKWYLVKQSSASGENWRIIDATRSPYNVAQDRLLPNSSAAESVQPNEVDFLSNGFKFRSTDGAYNGSGATYIYAAFAEHPFKTSRAR